MTTTDTLTLPAMLLRQIAQARAFTFTDLHALQGERYSAVCEFSVTTVTCQRWFSHVGLRVNGFERTMGARTWRVIFAVVEMVEES